MSDTKMTLDDVQKSLEALQNITKGHSSKGTNTTAVESMAGQGGATQVFHTPSNSNPGSWAGSTSRDVPENGASDAIDANGTDYNGGAQMVKSILSKIEKGLPVTAAEFALVKSAMEKGFPFGDKEDKKDEKKDEKVEKAQDDKKDEKDMPFGKSLSDSVAAADGVGDGFEVSEFLQSWSNAITKSLDAMEQRLARRFEAKLSQLEADQGTFQKGLATAISHVGNTVVLTAQRMDQIETAPARAPKAAQNVPFAKGAYGNEAPASDDVISKALGGDYISKAIVGDAIADLVVAGKAQPFEVVKFNTSGELSPALQKKVSAYLAGQQ